MKEYKMEGHAPSLLPDGDWELIWNDEFDGTELGTDHWDYRLTMMGKRHAAWTDRGVHLDGNSNAVFTLTEEDGIPVCSQLQTGYNFMDEPVKETKFGNSYLQWNIGKLKRDKFTHCYGYYECRCRLQQKEGWWSAFWIQSPTVGCSLDVGFAGNEIDIMESFHPGEVAGHNLFCGGYGQDMQRRQVGGVTLDETQFHYFGVLWTPEGYTFYVDGKEDGKITEPALVSHRPQFLLISCEPKGYRKQHHCPTREAFDAIGDTFLVDHVRVFDLK